MAIETQRTAKARLYLNAGKDPQTGKTITKNVIVGYLKGATVATADKVLAVANALAPCLTYQATRVERVVASSIDEG